MRPLFFILLALFSVVYAWEDDYAKALEMSQEDKKPLLLFFTGSDWSGLAMKMKNEILGSEDFQNRIGLQFHCVEIDFPVHKLLAPQVKEQNERLKNRFVVEEFPTLLLLDSEERVLARMGYFPESGELMAEELMHVVAQDAELCRGLQELPHDERALRRLYQLAQILMREEARQTILSAGVKEEAPFFLLEQYRLCIEEGKDVTSLREKLLKSDDYHIHFTMAMIDFQERASKLCEPLEVIKPLESYLERFGDQDEHNVWRIEMMMAELYLDADEWKTALKHAETAYENAPKTFQGEIEHSMDYIKSQIR